MNRIIVTSHFGGCQKCGRNDGVYTAGQQLWFACHTHKSRWRIGPGITSRWPEGNEPVPGWRDEPEDEQRERWAVVDGYQDIGDGALPMGAWPADHEIRIREFEAAHQKMLDAAAHRKRRDEIEETVAAILIEALKPVAADIPAGERISIHVSSNIYLSLSAAGVSREEGMAVDDDIPF
jgi:hypothetical protein